MAAKGTILKREIAKKILEVFPNAFLYNDGKEIRINGTEDGNPVQIKVTFTAAKVPVEGGGVVTAPQETAGELDFSTPVNASTSSEEIPEEPSEEEKQRLEVLLSRLGVH